MPVIRANTPQEALAEVVRWLEDKAIKEHDNRKYEIYDVLLRAADHFRSVTIEPKEE